MTRFGFLLFFMTIGFLADAQNFGGNPPGKWAEVNTGVVRVIFPVGLDSIAERVATIAQHLQLDSAYTRRHRKINIVLQNNATVSNAYVSLAPFRSEFFLMPPQNAFELGSLSWSDNLIVHEWRHVQQYNYFNRGLARAATAILGQEGRALLNAMAVPDWYFEGDAVWNETRYSNQGRGRLPLAFSGFKSLYLEGKDYSFMKLRNGSLKDYVPDHYDLGYLLVAYGAEKYGKDFWNQVAADASGFRPLFYPLQGAIRRHAGVSYKQFVKDAFNYYQQQWKTESQAEPQWLTAKNSYRTDYLFPYAASDGTLITLKQSSKSNASFVRVDVAGNEKRLAAQGISLDRYFSYNNGKIVYAGYYTDARWTNREYSNIVLVDLKTGSEKKISSKKKYLSPDISHDGNRIVAVNFLQSGKTNLSILDTEGNEVRVIEGTDGEVFSQPKFSSGDNSIFVVVRNAQGQMSLRKYFTAKELMQKTVVDFGNYIIGFPVVNGDTVTFSASEKTSDGIFAWVDNESKLYHLASFQTGIYQGVLRSGMLAGSVFTANGYRLASFKPDWNSVAGITPLHNLYVNNALQSDFNVNKLRTERFSYKRYPRFSHPLNFHSWRPYYDQPEYSFTVYGNNILNTVATELAYTYNENENSNRVSGTLIYGGTYLQPFAGISHTWNRSFAFSPDTVAHWNEFEWMAGLQLPLEITGGRMYRFLRLSADFHANDISFVGSNKALFRGTDVRYLQGRASFTMQIQQASQHIFPKFALTALTQLRSATNVHARQFLSTGSVYLPGFFRTHSIVISAAYQGRDTMRHYGFDNDFPFARGYEGGVDLPRMWKIGGNYHFPLVHPDWGFANLVYLRRIRANAFSDYAEALSLRTGYVYTFHSVGGELFFDTKWWNQLPVSFGVRYSRLLKNYPWTGLSDNQWEIVMPVDLIR